MRVKIEAEYQKSPLMNYKSTTNQLQINSKLTPNTDVS